MASSGGFFLLRFLVMGWRWVSGRWNITSKFEGTWEYTCVVAEGMEFANSPGSNAHGGECTIKITGRLFTTSISVKGKRTWNGVSRDGKIEKKFLKDHMEWRSIKGAFIGHDEIMYTYSIHNEPVTGITFLTLNFDKNDELLKPTGHFYYFPNSTDSHISQDTRYHQVRKRKTQRKFGEIYGEVAFSFRKKSH